MSQTVRLTAVVEKGENWFVAMFPEVDVVSQGATVEEARENLVEALTLCFEDASPEEVRRRMHSDVFITQVEVPVG